MLENKIELSIVIPVYFGEKTIGALVDTLHRELKAVKSLEIVLVNDGSLDNSDRECVSLVSKYPETVKYALLAKNFSEHNAVMAGLNLCTGQYAVVIDDDFQNPPSEIIKLYNKIKNTDSQVVYAYYEKKKHSWFRNLGSGFNDKVAQLILDKPKGLYLCSFKILKRELIEEIIKYKGPYPYIDGLILRATRLIDTELVTHNERAVGKSNYTFKRLVKLWSNMFINFSLKPLRWALQLGSVFSILGFIYALMIVVEKLQNPMMPLGWPTLAVAVTLFSGIQLLVLGMIGEFLGRMYLLTTGTPQYVIAKYAVGKNNQEKKA